MTQPAPAPAARGATLPAPPPPSAGLVTRPGATAPVASGAAAPAVHHGPLSRTPGRLRLAAAVAVAATLAIGVAGLAGGLTQASALDSAVADSEQQIRVLGVRNDMVAADATATNAFLVGGLEPVEQRAQYDDSLAEAAGGLTAVAGANGADAGTLAPASTGITTYSGLVEQARANNRQGFPVGAAYLESASTELRGSVLPALESVENAASVRVHSAFDAASLAQFWLVLVVVGLVVLVGVQVWLARRTHRRLNKGLVISSALSVLAAFSLFSALQAGAGAAADVRDGSYARTVAVARAFSLANDARAMESLTLIKRGSGEAYEEAYQDAIGQARVEVTGAGVLPDGLARSFDAWAQTHEEIRALDDAGSWDEAVALVTSTEAGSPNALFDAFAQEADGSVQNTGADAAGSLADAEFAARRAGWIALVAGVAAALTAMWGFGARLKEYR